tara:strand:- start:17016 stop:17687 length:672 start_codon:yes stop_codon:yes gene_type:complete
MGIRRGGGRSARYQRSFFSKEIAMETTTLRNETTTVNQSSYALSASIDTAIASMATVQGLNGQIQYNLSGSQSNTSMMYDVTTGFMGCGFTSLNDITHRVTLPNAAGNAGKVKAVAYTTYSSSRFKSGVQTIQNPISLISQMRGVTYQRTENNLTEYGFIAEEIGKVAPSLVEWEENSVDAQGLDYTRLVPILLEGIKSQQKQLETQQVQINYLMSIVGVDCE